MPRPPGGRTFAAMELRTRKTSEPVQLAQDSLGFVRRSCPQCARFFKVGAHKSEDLLVQSTFVSALQHANADELPGLPTRFCPYCGHQAQASAFLTEAQRGYIVGLAKELAGQVRYEQLRHAERHLDDNPYVTFVAVAPEAGELLAPPEPDDMAAAPLLCCGEDLKIKANWREPFFCHHCRAQHRAGGR